MLKKNRERFIYVLIGIGIGIVISGIIMLGIVLNLSENKVQEDNGIAAQPKIEPIVKEPVEKKTQIQVEQKKEEKKEVSIFVPEEAGATEVSKLLQEQGVVENADDFLKYIYKNKKSKVLKDGTITFPLHATYEDILALLTTY